MVYWGGWCSADYSCCRKLEGTLKDILINLSVLKVDRWRTVQGERAVGYEQSGSELRVH